MKCFQLFSQGTGSLFSSISSCFFRNGNRDCVPLKQLAVVQSALGPKVWIQFSLLPEEFEHRLPTSVSYPNCQFMVILDSVGNCCTTIQQHNSATFTR